MEKEAAQKAIAECKKALERTDLTEEERSDFREEWGSIAMNWYLAEIFKDDVESS